MIRKDFGRNIGKVLLATVSVVAVLSMSSVSFAQSTDTASGTVGKLKPVSMESPAVKNPETTATNTDTQTKADASTETVEIDKNGDKVEGASTDKSAEESVYEEGSEDGLTDEERAAAKKAKEDAADKAKKAEEKAKTDVKGDVQITAAPKKRVIKPESDWVVRVIPEHGNNSVAQCSLNKSFKSGQTLFFARDVGESNTIAIDFQNDVMEVGRQYVVFIKSGDITKQVTAIAATKQILIMKIGAGNELLDGFVRNREASFRMGADTLEFSFETDIIDALNKLTECASSLSTDKKFDGTRIVETSSPAANGSGDVKRSPPSLDSKITDTKEVAPAPVKSLMEAPKAESPKNTELAAISERMLSKDTVKKYLVKDKANKASSKDAGSLKLKLKAPTEYIQEAEEQDEEYREELEAQKKKFLKLVKVIKELKAQNEKLAKSNTEFKEELESQKKRTETGHEVINKTKEELLSEIKDLRQNQKTLAMHDAELQKDSQNILLDTQNKQMEIVAEIKRLKEENAKLKESADRGKEESLDAISKNKSEMQRLREENLKLSLQQEIEEEKRKKQELENTLEQNRIRSELLKLKAENTKLAMDFETGKTDVMTETNKVKQQNKDIADAARIEWENNKDFAATAYDTQQQLLQETEKLKAENQQLKALTLNEKEQTRKLAQDSAIKQQELDSEIERIKQQNADMLDKIQKVKERAAVIQQANEDLSAPTPLYSGAESYLPSGTSATDYLKKWLYTSGAAGSSYIEMTKNARTNEKIYRWQDSGVFGFAREIPDISSTGINKVVADYIKQLSNNCKGDFANTNGNVKMIAPYELLEAETACMNNKKDSAAVILFVVGRDKINIITQETAPGNINVAIENRDKIISAIR